jgi:ABC-type multidrug transport system fused ATPase/permease subunit
MSKENIGELKFAVNAWKVDWLPKMERVGTVDILRRVLTLLSKRDRSLLGLLLLLSVVFACIEAASVSLIMPFITLATDPGKALENHGLATLYQTLDFQSTQQFVIAAGITLVGFYCLRGAYVLGYTYALNRFTWGRYYDLAIRLFSNYLALPYRDFTQLNSSQLEKSIITEAAYLSQLIVSALRFLAEASVAALLYLALLIANPQVTLVVTLLLVSMAGGLTLIIRKVSIQQGDQREMYQSRFYHLLNDAFSNFKFTRQMGAERQMVQEVSRAASGYCRANVANTTVAQLPPTTLETIGLSLLVGLVIYTLLTTADSRNIIPMISLYALALYRMMPAAQRMLYYYNNVLYYRRSLDIVHAELSRTPITEGDAPIPFSRHIELHNISFQYPGRTPVLKDITLTIEKNERVLIVGPSGSGKTTLLDILIGIYTPDQGRVRIDGVELNSANVQSWRRSIGYIPQNVLLFDGTVGENIAFGKAYDESKVIKALQMARIWDFLQMQEGLKTHVGEGGVKLSGGQKQRIGIARALYGDPDVLVLDEATSALDRQTAEDIMAEVGELAVGRTLIVVSHHRYEACQFDRVLHVGGQNVRPESTPPL